MSAPASLSSPDVRSSPSSRQRRRSSHRLLRRSAILATVCTFILSVSAAISSRSTNERRLATDPARRSAGLAALAEANTALNQAVLFADAAAYVRTEQALDRATEFLGSSADVVRIRANLALTRHEFSEAEQLVAEALELAPDDVGIHLLGVDTAVERGRYDEALDRLETAESIRPSSGGAARRSYLKQLNGDSRGAALDLRQAVSSSAPGSVEQAVFLSLQGDVELEVGRVTAAEAAYRRASEAAPKLAGPRIGLARVAFHRGESRTAVQTLTQLTSDSPTPAVLSLQADLARSIGDGPATLQAEALLDESVALFRSNKAVLDAEYAIQLADRGDVRSVAEGIDLATAAYNDRNTLFTADALGWALYRAGDITEAAQFARQIAQRRPAIASMRARAALILAAAGDTDEALTTLRAADGTLLNAAALLPTLVQPIEDLKTSLGV
jgi:tetratricopeptide (TPR) repeat protein